MQELKTYLDVGGNSVPMILFERVLELDLIAQRYAKADFTKVPDEHLFVFQVEVSFSQLCAVFIYVVGNGISSARALVAVEPVDDLVVELAIDVGDVITYKVKPYLGEIELREKMMMLCCGYFDTHLD